MKRYAPGHSCTNPRQVGEVVHKCNKGCRDDDVEKDESIADKQMQVFTYDLQDFFTKVPREPFIAMLKKAREKVREEDPNYNYF